MFTSVRKSTEIFRQGCSFESSTSGVAHEDCRYRGHRPDRLEDRRHFARRGSRGPRRLAQKWRQHPSPAKGSKRPWPARRWRSTSPIRRHLKTRRCWNSSRLPGATFPAEAAAGVRHHVALSVVGTDRSDNGYCRAKVAQEKLIEASGIPYTIIRATQFMEFLGGIVDSGTDGNTVRLSPSLFQPIAADDVA